MKTFNESFEEFNKEYSYEKLFLNNIQSFFLNREFKIVMIVVLLFITIGAVTNQFSIYKWTGVVFVLISAVLYLYLVLKQSFIARKELKAQGNDMPIPFYFWNWKSEELNSIRIHKIYLKELKTKSSLIQMRIDIAKSLLNRTHKDPFVFFEKYIEYSGKSIIALIVLILVFELKNDYTSIKINETFKTILVLFIFIGAFIFFWRFLFKKAYFDDLENKNKKLKDYIYVMENILLLRHQQVKNNQ
ncbi:hypothetical protein [uncultured Polaribacter sp.]|uniref:hypothetical protein n=1 Tax=uncultured Polaribacter sp. TaxID=174711 RepID=UPI0026284E28|nr:hypothetical protein [uncultured Polaribacter sp.]